MKKQSQPIQYIVSFALFALFTLFAGAACNSASTPGAAGTSASDSDATTISNWSVSQSPLALTWQVPADLQADYEIDACDGGGNCSVFLVLNCAGMLTCNVLDGAQAARAHYTLTSIVVGNQLQFNYVDGDYAVTDSSQSTGQGTGEPVTNAPSTLSIRISRYLIDSD